MAPVTGTRPELEGLESRITCAVILKNLLEGAAPSNSEWRSVVMTYIYLTPPTYLRLMITT